MSESTIIFGFPGIGKSYAFDHQEELGLYLQDSDSSHFHWVYEGEGFNNPVLDENGNKIPHPAWPANYAQYIELTGREQNNKPDYILVSTHEEVMKVIGDLKFRSITVVPDTSPETKEHFLNLYKERGNTQEFIDMMDKNWEKFVKGTAMRGLSVPGEHYMIMVGPNRPYKNLYELLKNGIESLFVMEFDKEPDNE